jgi:hypothetical protein
VICTKAPGHLPNNLTVSGGFFAKPIEGVKVFERNFLSRGCRLGLDAVHGYALTRRQEPAEKTITF